MSVAGFLSELTVFFAIFAVKAFGPQRTQSVKKILVATLCSRNLWSIACVFLATGNRYD